MYRKNPSKKEFAQAERDFTKARTFHSLVLDRMSFNVFGDAIRYAEAARKYFSLLQDYKGHHSEVERLQILNRLADISDLEIDAKVFESLGIPSIDALLQKDDSDKNPLNISSCPAVSSLTEQNSTYSAYTTYA